MKTWPRILLLALLPALACRGPVPISGTGSRIWITREEYGDQSRTTLRYTDSESYAWQAEEKVHFLLEYRTPGGKVFRTPCRARAEQVQVTTTSGLPLTTTHTLFEAVVPTQERPAQYRILQDEVVIREEDFKPRPRRG